MNDILELLSHHTNLVVKIVIAVIAVISLAVKIIVPKVKERSARIKDAVVKENGEPYLQNGLQLYNQNRYDEGAELLIKGLELGGCSADSVLSACKALIHYYYIREEEHNSLRWARFAVDNNCFDDEVISYMIDAYTRMGEITKAEELKELLKNS